MMDALKMMDGCLKDGCMRHLRSGKKHFTHSVLCNTLVSILLLYPAYTFAY